jgi:hypothetical protein
MNNITNNEAQLELELSNGAATALINALVAAGSELARSDWERRFVCWIAENDEEVIGSGMVDFDVMEIAWSVLDLPMQKEFVQQVADRAGQPQVLKRLGFERRSRRGWRNSPASFALFKSPASSRTTGSSVEANLTSAGARPTIRTCTVPVARYATPTSRRAPTFAMRSSSDGA